MQLLILIFFLGLAQSLDVNSVHHIDDIIQFVKGANNRLSEASKELDSLTIDGKENYAEIVDDYLIQIPHTDKDEENYEKLKELVGKIDEAWKEYGTKDLLDDEDKNRLANSDTLDMIYDLYVGGDQVKALPVQIAKADRPISCELTMPDQIRLRKLHQAVVLSTLRGFILELKTVEDSQVPVAKAILRSEEMILAAIDGLESTVDVFRVCDPPEHVRGKTFGEFLGFFQGMIVNEGHTDAGYGDGKCTGSCDSLDDKRITKCYRIQNGFDVSHHCHKKPCNGRIFDCSYVGTVDACQLDNKADRRYPWVSLGIDKNPLGQTTNYSCDGLIVEIPDTRVGLYNCLTCMCVCVEEDASSTVIRSVSLIPQFANIKDNMIVTGIRFQEKDKLFHVQIEESKLGPYGEIDSSTSKWKKLNSFTYDTKSGTFKMRKGLRSQELYENFDYKIFNKDSRAINFDRVKTPYGEVIVGVSLRYNDQDDAIEIQILSWPFDFKTGELKNPVDLENADMEYDWITWENTPRKPAAYDKQRFEFSMFALDDPIKAPVNPPYSSVNEQLKIRATGFKLDMAQHTIPYLDLQETTFSSVKAPLTGIELYYKRAKGYGGFLGFKIINYDFSGSFDEKMTQDDIDKYKADFDKELVYEIPVKSM